MNGIYIIEIAVELIDCTLVLRLTDDPERGEVGASVLFKHVGAVRVNRYHDADDTCLGDFEPIRRFSLGGGRVRFTIDTGDAMLTFEASAEVRFDYAGGNGAGWPALFDLKDGAAE